MSGSERFAINGRFLTQEMTGVQRYAMNVVRSLDGQVTNQAARIVAPRGAIDPCLKRLPLVRAGRLSGYAWEQVVLPIVCGERLLSLCNTAPALRAEQIVCIHDANVFTSPDSYSRSFQMVYSCLQPLLARRSARIATVSHAAARQIARYLPVRVEDIAVLPNGHEHALRWDPARAQVNSQFPETSLAARPFVLALGSRARHKNLALLIAAADDLDALGIDVIIAGGDTGIFTAEQLEGKPNVRLLGRVSDDDLAYLLDRALCLAFPSLAEGFGLPIVEAMTRGCPVVASHCASMPEVCGRAALLASPFAPDAWVGHIRALRDSCQLRSDLTGLGREQVRRFSWEQTAAGYLDLLERPSACLPRNPVSIPPMPRVTVIFPTRGRPEIVAATVHHFVATQTLKPDAVIVSCVEIADIGDLAGHPDVRVVTGLAGLAAQRNTALAALPVGSEIVAFFDDDFVADKDWLAVAMQVFRDESQVVSFTGRVVADGIKGPGIPFSEAVQLVETAPASNWTWREPYSPYGCNMAFRVSAVGETRFDERLVLYGWLEDRDFAATVAKNGGRLVKSAAAFGVHMGVKCGRVAGERLGYSQIVNPLYMLGKGSMTALKVADHILRNMASNFGRAAWPEPFIDRRGRVRGNLLGIADVLRGRVEPERAATLHDWKAPDLPAQRYQSR